MGRPKTSEDTSPLHTRLSTSQRQGFNEYVRREQAKMPRGGVLTEAAVLRGMILRCLDLEGIPYVGAQQTLFSSPRAPVEEPQPPPPPPVEEPQPPPPPDERTTSETTTANGVTVEPVKSATKKPKTPPPRAAASPAAKKPKASPLRASTKSTAKKASLHKAPRPSAKNAPTKAKKR